MCRKALSKASGNTVSPDWTCAGSRCCRRAPSVSQSPDCGSAGDPVTSWLCQCRGPPDVVTWREPFRARPSRGSSGSAWGKDAEGRTRACPARADSFRGSPSLRSARHSSGDLTCQSSAVLEDAPGWQANVHESLGPP